MSCTPFFDFVNKVVETMNLPGLRRYCKTVTLLVCSPVKMYNPGRGESFNQPSSQRKRSAGCAQRARTKEKASTKTRTNNVFLNTFYIWIARRKIYASGVADDSIRTG